MPKLEENCEENMRYAEQIAEVKEKLAQDPESFALRFLLKRLQSKASTLERSAECEIDELMAPFCEGTDDPAYLEFEDRTDDLRRDYETDKINCVRFPDGTVVPEYSRLVCEKYLIKDGKVFQKKAGHLGHEKRTKKAKKMRAFMGYPVKKLYPSLKQYAEDYCGYTYDSKNNAYGYYCNPNTFWDWYSMPNCWRRRGKPHLLPNLFPPSALLPRIPALPQLRFPPCWRVRSIRSILGAVSPWTTGIRVNWRTLKQLWTSCLRSSVIRSPDYKSCWISI